jgi:F-type H+-transporting ATPase subunit delta
MAVGGAARRYAQALFELARERGALDEWLQDLRTAASALREPMVRAVLDAPQVPASDKEALVRESLSQLATPVQNLLLLLLRRQRIDRIGDVVVEFERLVDEARGVVRAELTTAVPLDEAAAQRLATLLAGALGREVRLSRQVNEGLIGGAVLRIGDKLLDGSVATRLQALRRTLVEAGV